MYQPEVFGRTAGRVYRIGKGRARWPSFSEKDVLALPRRRAGPGRSRWCRRRRWTRSATSPSPIRPGVARVVEEIERAPEAAFHYTARGNLVAVVTNGTAILGLGDRGPLAAKPVMEGKAILFKRFADIDVFDIELDARTADEMVAAVAALAPTFGGINLEDIKAPECFEVERRLKEMLDIPVLPRRPARHGHHHRRRAAERAGDHRARASATIKVVGERRRGGGDRLRRVLRHHGRASGEHPARGHARASSTAARRKNMNPYKERFAADTDERTLADAVRGADVFLGLSGKDVLTPAMLPPWRNGRLFSPAPTRTPRSATSWRGRRGRDVIVGHGTQRLSQPDQQPPWIPVHLPRRAGRARPDDQ